MRIRGHRASPAIALLPSLAVLSPSPPSVVYTIQRKTDVTRFQLTFLLVVSLLPPLQRVLGFVQALIHLPQRFHAHLAKLLSVTAPPESDVRDDDRAICLSTAPRIIGIAQITLAQIHDLVLLRWDRTPREEKTGIDLKASGQKGGYFAFQREAKSGRFPPPPPLVLLRVLLLIELNGSEDVSDRTGKRE